MATFTFIDYWNRNLGNGFSFLQILSCSSESDRTRWLEAFTPRTSDNPEEKIYEEWDCPQVQVRS